MNPLAIEQAVAVSETGGAGRSSDMVVHNVVLQGRCCRPTPTTDHCRLLLLCGTASTKASTEIRLLSSLTLDTIAILDLSAVLPRVLISPTSLPVDVEMEDALRAQEDEYGPESFRGAHFVGTDEDICAIAICVATRKAALGRRLPTAEERGDDGNCELFIWTPSIQSKGRKAFDLPSSQSDGGSLIALSTPPFRSIFNGSTTAGPFRWPLFSSSDGSFCSGFLAGTRLRGGSTNGLPTKRPHSAWFCNMLMMLDSDQQLWMASNECPTDFPGPMYPPGFTLMQMVEPYIEREDELDFVHTGVADLVDDIVQPPSTSNQLCGRSRFGIIDVGASSKPSISKLPLRLMLPTLCDTLLRSAVAASTTTTVEDKQSKMTKKRKRAAVVESPRPIGHVVILPTGHDPHDDMILSATEESSIHDDEPLAVNAVNPTLSLQDILPIPRRVLTGDFLQRMTRERLLGNKLSSIFSNPAAVIERLLGFEKEAVENVRRLEAKRDKNRKRDKKVRDEKARQRMQKNATTPAANATASEDSHGFAVACLS